MLILFYLNWIKLKALFLRLDDPVLHVYKKTLNYLFHILLSVLLSHSIVAYTFLCLILRVESHLAVSDSIPYSFQYLNLEDICYPPSCLLTHLVGVSSGSLLANFPINVLSRWQAKAFSNSQLGFHYSQWSFDKRTATEFALQSIFFIYWVFWIQLKWTSKV